jgi:hypothetical protein
LLPETHRQLKIETFTSGEIDIANRKRTVFHAMEWPWYWRPDLSARPLSMGHYRMRQMHS